MNRYPENWDRKQGKLRVGTGYQEWVDEGPVRWCACEAFVVYYAGRWGKLIKEGDNIICTPLRPCKMVTRKVFVNNHAEYVLDWLSRAAGYGYPVALLPDPTPRHPWKVAEEFDLRVPEHYLRRQVKIENAVATRKARMAELKKRGPSRAWLLADEIARLV